MEQSLHYVTIFTAVSFLENRSVNGGEFDLGYRGHVDGSIASCIDAGFGSDHTWLEVHKKYDWRKLFHNKYCYYNFYRKQNIASRLSRKSWSKSLETKFLEGDLLKVPLDVDES